MHVFFRSLRAGAGCAAAALALSACGGGGGSSAVPAAPRTGGPTGTTSASTTQQAAVNSAAQEVRAEKWVAQYAQPAHSFRRILHDHARHVLNVNVLGSPAPSASPSASPLPTAAPACSGSSSDTVTQNANGSITIHHLAYYDDACSILEDDATTTISAADASGKMTGTGTDTSYASDGKTVSEYDLLDLVIYNANPGSGDIAMRIKRFATPAAAAVASAVPLDTDWFAAVDTAPNTEKIGAASITQDPTFPTRQFGSNSTFTTTVTGGLFGTNQTTTVSGTTVNTQDPGGKLAVASYPLAAGAYQWTLTGGTIVNTTATSETSTADSNGFELAYTNTTTDAANDLTVTITGNVGGTQYTGIIKQTSTGVQLAKFVVDADGNGTITFADGSTKPVQNWCWGG